MLRLALVLCQPWGVEQDARLESNALVNRMMEEAVEERDETTRRLTRDAASHREQVQSDMMALLRFRGFIFFSVSCCR